MFLRVSIFTSILSLTVSGGFLQSSSADWYGIEIRPKGESVSQSSEKVTVEEPLSQNIWFESKNGTAESNTVATGQGATDVDSHDQVIIEPVESVWKATSLKSTEVGKEDLSKSVVPPAPAIDSEIASDVDNLLNQKEDWFAPIPGAEEASQKLETVAFEEDTNIADAVTYLDELRELDDKESNWVQSSVVISQPEINTDLVSEHTLIETQPMYVSELEEMANRIHSDPVNFIVNVSEGQMIAQTDRDNYNPVPEAPVEQDLNRMDSLFPSLSKISVTGDSTAPREVEITERPANLAAAHMESLIPGEYVMGPVVGVAAPSRYPVCFQHNPLYFEDPNLERCGVSHGCFTTTVSAARFLRSTFALPYLVVATPPRTCMATLGDCPTCASFDTDAYFREYKWNR